MRGREQGFQWMLRTRFRTKCLINNWMTPVRLKLKLHAAEAGGIYSLFTIHGV